MNALASTMLSIAMIAVFVLVVAGIRAARRREDRQRGLLMIAAAIVILGNVLIWTV